MSLRGTRRSRRNEAKLKRLIPSCSLPSTYGARIAFSSSRRRHPAYSEYDQSYYVPAPRLYGSGPTYNRRTTYLPSPRLVGGQPPELDDRRKALTKYYFDNPDAEREGKLQEKRASLGKAGTHYRSRTSSSLPNIPGAPATDDQFETARKHLKGLATTVDPVIPHAEADMSRMDRDRSREAAGLERSPKKRKPTDYPGPSDPLDTKYLLTKITRQKLYDEKKLILLVDLDSTVICSVWDDNAKYVKDIIKLSDWFIKPRPGLTNFLRRVSEKYEMVVVTMGEKEYAAEIVHAIDPNKQYFKNRVYSRDDMKVSHSKLEVIEHFPADVRDMCVAIDDSATQWSPETLIPVKRYLPFSGDTAAFPPHFDKQIFLIRPDLKFEIDDDTFLNDLSKWLVDLCNEYYDYALSRLVGNAAHLSREYMKERSNATRCMAAPSLSEMRARVASLTYNTLKQRQKLILLIDLENVLATYTFDTAARYVYRERVHLAESESRQKWVIKVRPKATEIIAELANYFEIIAVYNGDINYARQVLRLVDPQQKAFRNRMFAGDMFKNKKENEEILQFFDSSARDSIVIVDDEEERWPTQPVVVCPKYKVFKTTKQAFGQSSLAILPNVIPEDGMATTADTDRDLVNVLYKYLQVIYSKCLKQKLFRPENAKAAMQKLWRENKYKIKRKHAAV